MTYASDLGLKVGSKIKVLSSSVYFKTGEIIELVEDDGQTNPYFRGDSLNRQAFSLDRYKWEHYKEESKPKTPFQQAGYTTDMKFTYVSRDGYFPLGSTVWIIEDDGTECPQFTDGYNSDYCYVRDNLYEKADITPIVESKEGAVQEVQLVSITQEVKYTVVIKGTTFTFTQEELDALTEELLGFTTL